MKNKIVIVTGASSGIGEACAIAYAQKGAKLVLAARNLEKLKAVEQRIAGLACEVIAIKCDVSIQEDCKNLMAQAVAQFGTIDILINNAGISMRAVFNEMELDVMEKIMAINFFGTVYCTKYALPHILKNKGSVVGVSSIAGYVGLPARTGYSASKFAMQGFLEALRTENLKKGLHVMVACPGFTASNIRNTALSKDGSAQSESPRDEAKMMTAEQVANHIVKGVERKKRTLVLTTQGKLVVLLSKFFPTMVAKMVYNHMAKEPDSPIK